MDIFDKLIAREGGYVFTSADAGGETKYGISKRQFPHLDIKNITKAEARAIYVRDYYLTPHIDQLPLEVQELVLDWYVTSGSVAIKTLQRLTNCKIDGKIGIETINTIYPSNFQKLYLIERTLFYVRLCQKNPLLIKFLVGWISRTLQFLKD